MKESEKNAIETPESENPINDSDNPSTTVSAPKEREIGHGLEESVDEVDKPASIRLSPKAAKKMKAYLEANGEDSSWIDDNVIKKEPSDKPTIMEILSANKVFIIVFTVIMVLALTLIPAWFLYFRNKVEAPKSEVKYSIARYDHEWKKTPLSKKMSQFTVNKTQYIQVDKNGDNLYCIGFRPGGNNAPAPRHTMKAVLAFGDTKSRNFVMQNSSPISMGIKSGYINMEYCFVQTENEYSVLAVEALSEVDYNDPSKTWDAIYQLMMENTQELTDTNKRISAIMGNLIDLGVDNEQGKTPITAESIKQGTFYQFGYMMSETQRADYIPALFVDNTVKNADLSIYDPDSMWKYIKALPNMDKV